MRPNTGEFRGKPARRPNYLKEMLGGGLLLSLTLIIPQLAVFGLLVRYMRNATLAAPSSFFSIPYIDAEGTPVRKRDEWVRVFVDGVRISAIWVVLLAPAALVNVLPIWPPATILDYSGAGVNVLFRTMLLGAFLGGWTGISLYTISLHVYYVVLFVLYTLLSFFLGLLPVTTELSTVATSVTPVLQTAQVIPSETVDVLLQPSLGNVLFWVFLLFGWYLFPASLSALATSEGRSLRDAFGPIARTIASDRRYARAWFTGAAIVGVGLLVQLVGVSVWLYYAFPNSPTFADPERALGLFMMLYVLTNGVYFLCLLEGYRRIGRAVGTIIVTERQFEDLLRVAR